MKKNARLFPIYKLFSYDILFYFAISAVFLLNVKHLSLAEIALLSTAFSASSVIFQLPSAIITDRLGTKLSMIIGNILCMLWVLNLIICNSFIALIISEAFCALGFALKGVSESPFLLSSLKRCGKQDEFANIEAKGSALYFIVEAVACIASGYLYEINVYLPIIFACICCLIASLLALNFTSIPKSAETTSTKKYISDLMSGFKFIFKSKRLHAMLLFCCVFFGVISICDVLTKSYFTEFNLSSTGFGYVYAIFAIFAALGSKVQGFIEKRHKNRTLTFFSMTYICILLIAGIFALFNLSENVLIEIGVVLFSAQYVLKGAYRIIIKEYVTRYTTSAIRSKLMSIYYLSERIGSTMLTAFASLLLANYSIGMTFTIAGFVLIIIMILVLQFMHPRMGLKPESYTSNDRYDLKEIEMKK